MAAREGRHARGGHLRPDDGATTVAACSTSRILGYAHGDFDALHDMLVHPGSVLGLGDGGAHCGLLCDASLPTYMLTHWVRDRSRGARLGLEQAVHMQTRGTASLYGFDDRGLLAPGYLADVNVIDFDALACDAPTMVYDLPAGGPPPHPAGPRLRRHGQARRGGPRGRRGHRRTPGRAAPRRPAGADGLAPSHTAPARQ